MSRWLKHKRAGVQLFEPSYEQKCGFDENTFVCRLKRCWSLYGGWSEPPEGLLNSDLLYNATRRYLN